MRRSRLGPLAIGLGGVAVLLSLGVWQLQRLQWKNGLIAEAERRMEAAPVPLPDAPDATRDDYKPVFVEGVFDNDGERYVLTSLPPHGPGFKIITPLQSGERRILVDRGFVPQVERDPSSRSGSQPEGLVRVEGVLRWPDDRSRYTPEPDRRIREWYARDVASLADDARTEPVMIVQSNGPGDGWPRAGKEQVTMRNQHLPYALTWFSLALVWAAMSFVWFRKLARESRGE